MEQTYYKHKLQNLIVVNKVVTIHYFEFDKHFKSRGEKHDFWELVYTDKGSIVCSADGKEILLNEGEMLFHKPNEFHTLSADTVSAPNVFIISFECKNEAIRFFENKRLVLNKKYLKFIYMLVEESKKTFHLPYSDPELKKMQLLKRPTLGGEQLIKNLLEILLINIMRDETESEHTNTQFLFKEELDGYVAKRILEFLNERLYQRIKIDDLCETLNYNKSYLFRQFKTATGRTIMQYFIDLKIEESKKLLRSTDLSVSEIAYKLSFDSPNYFSKTFKKKTQYTPLQYKKLRWKR
ncbi:MAG: helix-turn-helix transcriptional regulator [Clostridia bacterium]|nr:helix-turn-helix transcriptional regulator [Clostridia bacterium]